MTLNTVVVIRPPAQLDLVSIPVHGLTFEFMRNYIGGYLEAVLLFPSQTREGHQLVLYGDEEARLKNLPFNVLREDGEPLHGHLLLAAVDQSGETAIPTLEEQSQLMIVQQSGRPPVINGRF